MIDEAVQLHLGDARAVAKWIPKESVQTIVTSPPYFHGRLYDGPDLVWGDLDGECWIGQLGQEPTIELYTAHLVEVFTALRPTLSPTGTLWLNLGDAYAGAGYGNHRGTGGARKEDGGRQKHLYLRGIKPKNLLGLPWRVALALQASGWILRSDIIWRKIGAQPESVNDRPVKEYEHIFLFSKNQRYLFRAIANAVPKAAQDNTIRNGGDIWDIHIMASKTSHNATMPELLAQRCILIGSKPADWVLDPFGGSGTTAVAAWKNGRKAISIEVAGSYHTDAEKRIENAVPGENVEFKRVSGEMICKICGLSYYRHPDAYEVLSYDQRPFLNRLCTGELVKL